jgi:hypothetical protein
MLVRLATFFRLDMKIHLEYIYQTEVSLVYAPSQLALSAIIHAGKTCHMFQARYEDTLRVYLPDRGVTGLRILTACSLSHHTCWYRDKTWCRARHSFIYFIISLTIHTLFFLEIFSCWVFFLPELGSRLLHLGK